MTDQIVRSLQHAAIDDPEMAWQYSGTAARLEAAEGQPVESVPMIRRTSRRYPVARCKRCGKPWHSDQRGDCPTSIFNLRD